MTPARRWLALGGLCLGFFMLLLDSTIVSVALPDIGSDLGTDASLSVWVNSAYLFAFAVPLLVAGRLGDRFGHRRVYLLGLAVFTVASVGCAFAPGIGALIVWRAVQGVGAALLTPQCLTVIRSLFEPPRLAVALAVWSAGGGAATVAGPIVGGVLVEAWGWPSVFLVNVPVGIVTAIAVLRFVPVSRRIAVPLPVLAVVGVTAGVFAVVVGVQGTGDGVLAAPLPRVGLVVLGALVVAAVLTVQRRAGDRALVPLGLFRDRGFVTGSWGATAASFCVGSAPIPLMLDLQDGRGLGPGAAALVLVPMGVACLAAAPFVGRTTNTAGPRATATIGAVLLVVSVALTAVLIGTAAPLWAVATAFTGFGVANAFVWSPFSLAAVLGAGSATIGAASSTFNTVKQLGAVLGSTVTAVLLAVSTDAVALGALALAALGALVAAASLPGRAPAVLTGAVVHGAGVGHGLGFPTANLLPDDAGAVPSDGVYVGWLTAPTWSGAREALVSIGSNSTFADRPRTVEIHVLDFDGDLYGTPVELTVGRRLRRQRTFPGPDALVAAMRADERRARTLLARS
ncbi:EmrB/QacA subfamily drug resistance transporter [Curtobacterium sp. PhB137]|uniref:MDR family MFS transporter n=1 Tax=Curtobacterium sp. PhB137 TaxID=2485182 RepID=UPI000FB715B2|nr:MDR family MFS transporter [Curtobacterium sp. PhB137]RPE76768.1 EmrB/QacA subfamily drug resistance transporter [Curtobacterium sp. PhB137]